MLLSLCACGGKGAKEPEVSAVAKYLLEANGFEVGKDVMLDFTYNTPDELATAMECRCYRGDYNRTKLVKLEYRLVDAVWFLIFILFLGVMIASVTVPYAFGSLGTWYDVIFYKI